MTGVAGSACVEAPSCPCSLPLARSFLRLERQAERESALRSTEPQGGPVSRDWPSGPGVQGAAGGQGRLCRSKPRRHAPCSNVNLRAPFGCGRDDAARVVGSSLIRGPRWSSNSSELRDLRASSAAGARACGASCASRACCVRGACCACRMGVSASGGREVREGEVPPRFLRGRRCST